MIITNEKELQDELVIYLKEQGFSVSEYVFCSVGIADVVIDNAVTELKHLPDREALFKAVGQAIFYRGAINKELNAKVICSYYQKASLELAITAVKQLGIELIPWLPGDPLVFETDKIWRLKNTYQAGDVCWISSLCKSELLKYNKYWAIVTEAFDYECKIQLCGKEFVVPTQHLKPVGEEYTADIKAMSDRILKLAMRDDLDPFDRAGLEVMQTRTFWTDRQKTALSNLEQVYEIIAP